MIAAALRNCRFLESNDLIEKLSRNSYENGGLSIKASKKCPVSEWLLGRCRGQDWRLICGIWAWNLT